MIPMELDQSFIESVDFTLFHSDDYIDILKTLNTENKELFAD